MVKRTYPSADAIRQLLDYDPDTGLLKWKIRTEAEFTPKGRFSAAGWCAIWNGRMAGRLAGSTNKKGYVCVSINNTLYPAHRIAFIHYHGGCDADAVDHVNGDPTDNRIQNLRAASTSQNHFNKLSQRNSKTGVKGVRFSKGKFVAQINVSGRRIHLGRFETLHGATQAFEAAAARHHGNFAVHLRGSNGLG